MKIGIDFHNVITDHYAFFSELARLFTKEGHEVHIITGSKKEKLLRELKDYPMMYNEIFSMVDYASNNKIEVWHDEKGDPWMDDDSWNKLKANYCKENKIDIHFDDSTVYGQFFSTPYCQFSLNKQ